MSRLDEDIYLKPLSLPVEEQRALTLEEKLQRIDSLYTGKKEEKKNPYPLTTDVIGRGYPINQEEIEAIRLVNEAEERLLAEDPSREPVDEGYKYYIVEDGRIFKTQNGLLCFGLDFSNMTWEDDPTFVSILYDTMFKFSRLDNFRDYYPMKQIVK